MSLDRVSKIVVAASCLLFLLSGLAILPYPGIQNDEALFAAALYAPKWFIASVSIGDLSIPTMQMTYLGCLKAWVYKPIFSLWPPSVYSIRVPVLIAGIVTIYMFWLLLRRATGDRAAIIGTILLSSDTTFLFTTCFDWGPVVLQHLLMLAGVLSLLHYYQSGKDRSLGFGFFLFGLGLWDKALFAWTLAGFVVALLLVYPHLLWTFISWRRMLISVVSFSVGAFPLLWYNLAQKGNTFGSSAKFSLQAFPLKLVALTQTMDGSQFFGYLVAGSDFHPSREAHTILEHFVVTLGHTFPLHRSFLGVAFVVAIFLHFLFWKSRTRRLSSFLFLLMACVWSQMAITVSAGTGAHHVVLMWPWPMLFIAIAFSEASVKVPRIGLAAVVSMVVLLFIASMLLDAQYLTRFIEDGSGLGWTDAVFPLAEYLQGQRTADIYSTDWGITNSLRVLDRGTLRLQESSFILMDETRSKPDEQFLENMLSRSSNVLVRHTAEFQAFPNINMRLDGIAAARGFRRLTLRTIYDYEGHAVFEVFRFQSTAPQDTKVSVHTR